MFSFKKYIRDLSSFICLWQLSIYQIGIALSRYILDRDQITWWKTYFFQELHLLTNHFLTTRVRSGAFLFLKKCAEKASTLNHFSTWLVKLIGFFHYWIFIPEIQIYKKEDCFVSSGIHQGFIIVHIFLFITSLIWNGHLDLVYT